MKKEIFFIAIGVISEPRQLFHQGWAKGHPVGPDSKVPDTRRRR